MRIITYNILADCTLHHFPDPNASALKREQRTPLIIDSIRRVAADIVCLQEVDHVAFAALQEALTDYSHSRLTLNRDGRFGCAMFVKKSKQCQWEDYSFNDASGRIAQIARLDQFMVVNIHLDFRNNCDQIRSLVKKVEQDCFVCGDFNASINSGTLRIAREAGFDTLTTGSTINTDGRAKVIDFILTKGSIKLKSVKASIDVHDSTLLPSETQGSDHVPVIADF